MLISGKHVFVSGGSRGLGNAFCRIFSKEGANISFNYNNDEKSAEKTQNDVRNNSRLVQAFKVSVLDAEGLRRSIQDAEATLGDIDILINNAGVSLPLPLALTEEEDWDRVIDINLKGQFLVTKAVLPGMIRRRHGVVLNIGSLAGVRLIEAPIHYAASKAAIKGFTEALCKEMNRYNIRVNCLAPGLLNDGVGLNLPDYRLQDYLSHVALGRVGELDEVAQFAAFLVSDRNTYMNGETISMDGGF